MHLIKKRELNNAETFSYRVLGESMSVLDESKFLLNQIAVSAPTAAAKIRGGEMYPQIYGEVDFYNFNGTTALVCMLHNLPETATNIFGFHIHEGSECVGDFSSAGSHYDMGKTATLAGANTWDRASVGNPSMANGLDGNPSMANGLGGNPPNDRSNLAFSGDRCLVASDHPNHKGDLPVLFSSEGDAFMVFCTNRFRVSDVIGRTVIVHLSPDDYTSQPAGNSGERIACGVIRKY